MYVKSPHRTRSAGDIEFIPLVCRFSKIFPANRGRSVPISDIKIPLSSKRGADLNERVDGHGRLDKFL
jgi:hypothetical protein